MTPTHRKNLRARVTVGTTVLAGKPIIRGMRISAEQIVMAVAAGVPQEELLVEYPGLEPEDIQAALHSELSGTRRRKYEVPSSI